MPTIGLNNIFGLDLDGSLAPDAKLTAILQSFRHLADLRLDEVPVESLSAGLNFTEPITLPGGLGLSLGASGGGRFGLIGPVHGTVEPYDPFGTIPVRQDERYLMLALTFSFSEGVSGAAGPASFGFSADQYFEIRCYRRFQRGPDGFPKFSQAFAAAAAGFFIPKQPADIDSLPADTIVVLDGTGTLTASAGISVAFPTQELASVSLGGLAKLQVNAGARAGFSARIILGGEYQVRLLRLPTAELELGLYRSRSRETALTVSAQVGVTAGVGSFDVAEALIGALSQQPEVDIEEFRKALPGEDDTQKMERIDTFETPLKAAISTKLQASVAATLTNLQEHECVWMFAVNPAAAISDAAKSAIAAALRGNFENLTRDPQTLPAGIRQTENVLSDTDLRKLSVKINLLGLVNVLSVSTLAKLSSVERNANGDITLISDAASERRLQALLVNFGNNRKRLRKLLSENFLISAAYRAKDLGVLPPQYRARHTFFEIHDTTNREEMKNSLDVARVFGLMTPADVEARLGTIQAFGRTDFYAEARYDDQQVRSAYLQPQGMSPSTAHYEQIGRSALGALLMGDEGQEFRKRLAEDDALWARLKEVGNRAKFASVFGLPDGSLDPRVEAAGVDYSVIRDWADAMTAAGAAIGELDVLLGNTSVAPDDPRLTQARATLKNRLADVVKNTKEEFGDPLGMVMFYCATNESADKTVRITGPQIATINVTSVGAITAGAGD
jgi:hypothetical protein